MIKKKNLPIQETYIILNTPPCMFFYKQGVQIKLTKEEKRKRSGAGNIISGEFSCKEKGKKKSLRTNLITFLDLDWRQPVKVAFVSCQQICHVRTSKTFCFNNLIKNLSLIHTSHLFTSAKTVYYKIVNLLILRLKKEEFNLTVFFFFFFFSIQEKKEVILQNGRRIR